MIKLALGILEDQLPKDLVLDWDLGRAHAPDTLLAYWRTALERLQDTPRFTKPDLNKALVSQGYGKEPITIEVLLCTRASADALSECTGALGVHLISNHDADPFDDNASCARKYRVLVVSDPDEFIKLTKDLAQDDASPERYLGEYLEAYLNTVFHEIGHALLFAENAALLPPCDIESLSDMGEIGNDIFDCSTGYGIRPLLVDGDLIWADDMDDATDLMEAYVEELGRIMMLEVLTDALSVYAFPEAMGVQDKIDNLIS
jgi:hypothetical protein